MMGITENPICFKMNGSENRFNACVFLSPMDKYVPGEDKAVPQRNSIMERSVCTSINATIWNTNQHRLQTDVARINSAGQETNILTCSGVSGLVRLRSGLVGVVL